MSLVNMTGVMALPDVRNAGPLEWDIISGVPAYDPLVGSAAEGMAYDVDSGKSRIVTQYASGMNEADHSMGDWRDAFNWQHSPIFWVMLASVLAFGLVHLSVHSTVHVGKK